MNSFNDPSPPPPNAANPTSSAADLKSPGALLDLLFDLSFTTPITPRVMRWLYIISIIAAGLVAISSIITGFSASLLVGLISIFIAPVLFAIYVIIARVALEVVLAIFQIADSLRQNNPPRS